MPRRGVRDGKKAAQWQGIIRRQGESGLSIVAFCRKRNLSVGQFHWWKRRLGEADGQQVGGGFVELMAPGAGTDFSGVEVDLDDRVRIRLARGFDPEVLKAVLVTLGARAG